MTGCLGCFFHGGCTTLKGLTTLQLVQALCLTLLQDQCQISLTLYQSTNENPMFKRDILKRLSGWAEKKDRKPLIRRGARQVGKTTAIHLFFRTIQLISIFES